MDADRAVYGQLESFRNYNHIYENDISISRGKGSVFSAELYSGKKKGMVSARFVNETGREELLRAVSFGSPYSGYQYRIYVGREGENPRKLKEGYVNYAGVHTVRLDSGVTIGPEEAFDVFVALELPVDASPRVGMFYSTDLMENMEHAVGHPCFYYPKGDDDFGDAVYTCSASSPIRGALL